MSLYTNKSATSASGGTSLTGVKVVTAQAESGLDAEVNLGALTTGLLKHTVSGGVSTPATAVANTDYLAPDWDVVTRATLGADAQEITIAVSDSDERIEIDGYGDSPSADYTIRVNDNATVVVYSTITQVDAAAPGSTSAYWCTTGTQPFGFRIVFDIKNLGLRRGGFAHTWTSQANGTRDQYLCAFRWPNTADNVTQVILRGSAATSFKSGFRYIVRRKKMT